MSETFGDVGAVSLRPASTSGAGIMSGRVIRLSMSIAAACVVGGALGFVIVAHAAPILVGLAIALLAAAPAIALYWIGTSYARRQRARVLLLATEEFGAAVKQSGTAVRQGAAEADFGLVASRPGIWTRAAQLSS
jgi:hypothetical protein